MRLSTDESAFAREHVMVMVLVVLVTVVVAKALHKR
jgi:hypothetical protein